MAKVWRSGILVLAASLTLAACGGSDSETTASNGNPPATSGSVSAPPATGGASQAPAPAPTTPPVSSGNPPPVANSAPLVSGSPAGAATAGQAWSFQPSASDPDGDALTWSISGKPADAVFSTATGQLVWTPSGTGTWNSIVITATDSRGASTSLAPFSIQVAAPQQVAGEATLAWDIPQQYTDGQPLAPDDLVAGYRVYHGTSQDALDTVASVQGATTLQHTIQNLTAGTHYFAVSAVSVNGAEGARSEILSKTVM